MTMADIRYTVTDNGIKVPEVLSATDALTTAREFFGNLFGLNALLPPHMETAEDVADYYVYGVFDNFLKERRTDITVPVGEDEFDFGIWFVRHPRRDTKNRSLRLSHRQPDNPILVSSGIEVYKVIDLDTYAALTSFVFSHFDVDEDNPALKFFATGSLVDAAYASNDQPVPLLPVSPELDLVNQVIEDLIARL